VVRDAKKGPVSRGPDYLERALRHTGRPFAFTDELALMVTAAADPEKQKDFEEALFLAKFIVQAQGVLRRSGPDTDDVANLSVELTAATEKISVLIGKLAEAGSPEIREGIREKFLALEPGSFMNLQGLIGDLAALKNFELDRT
jgi:hypothetical protein